MNQFIFITWLAVLPLLLGEQRPSSLLLISEVDYDPPSRDEVGEWVELVNLGDEPLPLAGYKIGDEEQLGHGEGMFRFPERAVAAPGAIIVIARNAPAFRARFGANPDFEFYDGDPDVADMRPYAVWGTGELFLANDGDEVVLVGPDNVIVDAVNWGDSTYFFTPSVRPLHSGQSLARSPAHCDRDSAADWMILDEPSPGTVVTAGQCRNTLPSPGAGEITGPIGAIQGNGASSPYLDQVVTVRGIVTGIHEDRNSRGAIFYTFFVQNEPADADADPATSDALPVFTAVSRPSVGAGDVVQVTGRVTEFYGLTEIDFRDLQIVLLESRPHPLPPAVPLSDFTPENLERLEGMRVGLPPVRVAGATHSGCGFAVATLDTPLPLVREDPLVVPGQALPILHHSDVDCDGFPAVKRGDLVDGLAGPLTYRFDQYQLVQQDSAAIVVSPVPLPEPLPLDPASEGQFTVVTVNLHDYFAADPLLTIRQDKITQLLATYLSCPTVIALQEVESEELLREITRALQPLCGTGYVSAHRDGPDSRGLDVALLAAANRVRITAVTSHQACTALDTGIEDRSVRCPQGQSPLHSRPPLQADVSIDSVAYTFFTTHLKSKREGETETARWRLAQATHVAALVTSQLEAAPDTAVLVAGDFNDLPGSPTLKTLLTRAPLADPLRDLPSSTRYTYVFGGYAELLDNILLSPVAAARLTGAGILHMNTDFPFTWTADASTPFRASDHDVPWVTLRSSTPATERSTLPVAEDPALPPGTPAAAPQPTPQPLPEPNGGLTRLLPLIALGAFAAGAALALLLARQGAINR
ncbi:MAG: lamin tail domain-containing protein [Anaerolineae bacterium]|nr:lamin tail domain-containing protein [Anaerolineae bacterium]